ncbi:MAG: EamA family transporter [Chitinophagales bacterium]|nr:EamA family transporter [Chitinophagales bacterium]
MSPLTKYSSSSHNKAIFALVLVCFFWGTTWLASRVGVEHMPALQLAGIRQLIGGSIYVGWFLYKGMAFPKGKEWVPVLILSFLNFIIANGFSTWGLEGIRSGGLGAIIGAIFPLWLVFIGLLGDGKKMPVMAIVGLVIGFGGVCVIFAEHFEDFFNPEFLFGIILSLIATLAWAFGTLYTKKQALHFNAYFSLGIQMLISGVVLSIIAPVSGRAVPMAQIPWEAWASIAYLVLFGSVISFVAYLYALQRLPTELASIYAYINPIVAVVLGALFFQEKLTIYIALGGIITILGVYLVNRAYKL